MCAYIELIRDAIFLVEECDDRHPGLWRRPKNGKRVVGRQPHVLVERQRGILHASPKSSLPI
jgi:hypothetical protein